MKKPCLMLIVLACVWRVEAVSMLVLKVKKCKKAKCLRRPYKLAVNRRGAKGKGEKARYTHLM